MLPFHGFILNPWLNWLTAEAQVRRKSVESDLSELGAGDHFEHPVIQSAIQNWLQVFYLAIW